MVHTRLQHTHRWHLTICPTVLPRPVSRHNRNRCQLSERSRWQLAPRRCLFEISGPAAANRSCDWLERWFWEVIDLPRCSPDLESSDLLMSGSIAELVVTCVENCVIWKPLQVFEAVREGALKSGWPRVRRGFGRDLGVSEWMVFWGTI